MLNPTKPAAYERVEVPCVTCGTMEQVPPWVPELRGPIKCYDCDPERPTFINDEDPIVSFNGHELVADVYNGSIYIGTRVWSGNRTADQHPQDVDATRDLRRQNRVVMVSNREARQYAQRILDALGPETDDE